MTTEELLDIQRSCTATTGTPEEVLQWFEAQGIERNEFGRFVEIAAKAHVYAMKTLGMSIEDTLSASFAAGFEVGIRFSERKQA